jgi:hypothetical protein
MKFRKKEIRKLVEEVRIVSFGKLWKVKERFAKQIRAVLIEEKSWS